MTDRRSIHPAPLLLGTVMIAAFIEFGRVSPFGARAGYLLEYIGPREMRYWLGYLTMALPGLALFAAGLSPMLRRPLVAMWNRLDRLSTREVWIWSVVWFAVLLAIAVIGREVFLYGRPITDDENMVAFGARILTHGHLSSPILQPDGAFTQSFTYRHAGRVMSVDYPGGIVFAAAAIVTHLGSLLYALAAAATGVFVVAAAGTVSGPRARLVAAVLWIVSPMAICLGLTTHAQLVSRCCIAGATFAYVRLAVAGDRRRRIGLAFGLFGGYAFLTRSPEATAWLLPVLVHLAIAIRRDRALLRPLAWAAAAAAAALGFYAWYNLGTTGIFYLPARFAPGGYEMTFHVHLGPLLRLGSNAGQNWLILVVMALGPIGMLLAAGAVRRAAPWTITLGSSILLALALALAHDDTGIHTVGPIHYSEVLPALILLATDGLVRLLAWSRGLGMQRLSLCTALVGGLVGGLATQTLVQLSFLRHQASNDQSIFAVIEKQVAPPAIVIGPPPQDLTLTDPAMRDFGSWVHWWPPPDPALQDPIIYVNGDQKIDLTVLHRRFPDRHFYRVTYTMAADPVRVAPIP